MADERIDIEVNDQVSTGPAKKLRDIGDAAGTAHKFVERLKADLASMDVAGMVKAEAATNSTTRAIAQQMNAQARLTDATSKSALADAKAATQKQKLATELARTEAAQAKAGIAYAKAEQALNDAVAAENRAKASAERLNTETAKTAAAQAALETELAKTATQAAKTALETQKLATETARNEAATSRATQAAAAAALAELRLANARDKAATSTNTYAARAERLKSSLDPAYAAQSRFNAEVAEAKTLLDNGAIGMNTYEAAVAGADARLKAAAGSIRAMNASSRTYSTSMHNVADSTGLAGHQMGNLVAQLNDIGVSLAGGQNPLLVLIQQGSQIQYLASTVEGGFTTLLKATTALVIGQQQVTNATTAAAAANTASARAANTAAAANALQAGIAANLATTEMAVAAAQTEAGAAAARKAVADAQLSSAQAVVAATAVASTQALQRLAIAELQAAAAAQGVVLAEAELAAALSSQTAATLAAAQAQERLALSSAGTALGLGTVGAILVGLAPVAITVAAGMKEFHDEINKEAGIKEYVKTLGLTKKELKELKDQTVTYGDIASGTWATVKEGLVGIQPILDAIGAAGKWAIDLIWDTLKRFTFSAIALFKGTYNAVIVIWNQFPAAFKDIFAQAVNGAASMLEGLANRTIDVLNSLGGNFQHVTLKRMENANAGAASKMGSDIVAGYMNAYAENEAGYNAFLKRAGQNSAKAARERLANDAKNIIDDRTERKPKKPSTANPKTQSDYLDDTNKKLDNELSRMKMLKDAREVQGRLDQIEEDFLKRRMPLDKAQLDVFRQKIQAINDYKYVQAESDRIMEASVEPQRTMNAAVEAATKLYEDGHISVERYTGEIVAATRAFEAATDPLHEMKEANAAAERTMKFYGDALARANDLETIRAAYLEKNLSMYDATTGKLKEEVVAQLAKNQALRDEQLIKNTITGIVDPMLQRENMLANEAAYYAELKRLRDNDTISEQQYQQAKYNLAAKFNEMKLEGASQFFGELAGLQSSSSRTLATIGKAAAIADATIKGYQAAQNALATVPYPFNIAAAAAIAIKTGANVAAIASTNVGSYNNGGSFMVEGKSGIDTNNINMNVSRGERVTIETAAQQRANDNGGNGTVYEGDVKVINMFDEAEFIEAMDSPEGERVIRNMIKRNPNWVKGQ